MEIAFIHPSSPTSEGSGATHSATEIVESLSDRGHNVTVYCGSKPQVTGDEVDYEVAELHVKKSTISNFSEQLNKSIKQNESELGTYDVVHSYLMRSVPAMGELGTQTATNPVVTLNAYGGVCPRNDLLYKNETQCTGDGPMKCTNCVAHESVLRSRGEQNSVLRTIAHAGYRIQNRLRNYRMVRDGEQTVDGISHFHALSPPVKEHYMNFGYPEERISVIPNMLDSHFEIPHQSDFTEPFKLLYVGAIRHRKGVDRMIEVVDRLRNHHNREVHLSIVGDGPLLPSLETRIVDEDLEDAISVIGYIPYEELPTLYASHDLFLYLGRWDEPFGRVFLEALSTGTPVFATDVGHIRSIINDGGFISTGSDVSTIAKDLDDVLDTDTIAKRCEQTRKNLERYRPQNVVNLFVQMYESLV